MYFFLLFFFLKLKSVFMALISLSEFMFNKGNRYRIHFDNLKLLKEMIISLLLLIMYLFICLKSLLSIAAQVCMCLTFPVISTIKIPCTKLETLNVLKSSHILRLLCSLNTIIKGIMYRPLTVNATHVILFKQL